MHWITGLGLGALLSGHTLCAQSVGTTRPLATSDAAAAEIYRQTGSTAMVLVLVRGSEVHLQSFGEVTPGAARGPSATSLIRLCSLTKIFAADLLAKLVADGSVKLTDPLQLFAPAATKVPTATLHGPVYRELTLGDLATHTAGLPREIGSPPPGTPPFTYPNHAQRWAWLPQVKLRTSPGTAALYSNVGFDLLGDALQAAAHKPYAQLLAERTTRPLGMRDTTFSPTSEECSRMLVGWSGLGALRPEQCPDTQASAGSAGLYSTPGDMGRWLQYLQSGANAGSLAVYVQPADLLSVKGLDHAGEPTGIGLGWMVFGNPGDPGTLVEKTGGGAGFTTYIALDPVTHTGLFMALTEGEHGGRLNPFKAANNLLLAVCGLPPMSAPEAQGKGVARRSRARRGRTRYPR